MSVATSSASIGATGATRWIQLVLGLIAMMSISSPQYVWTLFVKPFQDATRRDAAGDPDHVLDPDRAADLAVAAAGLARRQFGPRLLIAVGAVLSGLGWVLSAQVDEPRRALSHLWAVVRHRHRHRLYRHHRADGALVPRPARLRHRHGRGRLRLRRDPDHVPDRHACCKSSGYQHDAGGVRHYFRRDRRRCGAGLARAAARQMRQPPSRAAIAASGAAMSRRRRC